MPNRNWIERSYAEFYDSYTGGFAQDIPIYLDIAAKYPGPILEVGCATGRVTARLASAGHEVHGIDTSRRMLEIARQRLRADRDQARISDHDLRLQPMGERYHVALLTLHSFNVLIDIEEQRLLLRHLQQSIREPGIVAIDAFCPLTMVRPERVGEWREIERTHAGRYVSVRDLREMLTPLLERRTQVFRVEGGPPTEVVTHRRYVPPGQFAALLEEAGFESIRWLENYDTSTLRSVDPAETPTGPFLVIAEL